MFSAEETSENHELDETHKADLLYNHIMQDRISTYVKAGSPIRPDKKNWNAFIIGKKICDGAFCSLEKWTISGNVLGCPECSTVIDSAH